MYTDIDMGMCDGLMAKGAYAKYKMYRYICVQEADQRVFELLPYGLVYRFT